MMERLIIVSLVITMSAFSEASSCETVFQVFSACSLSAGGVLNTFTNIRSKIECTFLCIQDDMCLSSMFSESGECHLYSEYKSFTPCTSQDFYLSLYEVRFSFTIQRRGYLVGLRVVSPTFPFAPESFRTLYRSLDSFRPESFHPFSRSPPGRFGHYFYSDNMCSMKVFHTYILVLHVFKAT